MINMPVHRVAAYVLPFVVLVMMAPGLFVIKDILDVRFAPARFDLVASWTIIGLMAVLSRYVFNWIPAECPKCKGRAFVMPDTKMARYLCRECGQEQEMPIYGGD